MVGAVLIVVLLLVVGGCGCVVWAERGGPKWVRGVARVTLGAGRVARWGRRNRNRQLLPTSNPGNSGDAGGVDGSSGS
ncbi:MULTISPECIES: hypothetical protein [Kitasatospora]|uniref:Uncharacterized protein n=1 Tax=Kitasatospora setae (strain ATCC 33774 / DSM 43861 / JCM 3304 / KCC A-0304 / NBRC 14216 / KM-6054) TaxID=452652 RepID=E4N731_KITSK|nr:hypothetical protein [Kitasatospora setae]BAJ27012.1 hypothetical protein KSE_11780 [Kitasatospora setae KM-6054]